MIELSARPASGASRILKIFGIGGAGANALDRLALDGANPCHLVAVNSDAPALTASVARERLQIGSAATRGLGCGGDPDLGRASVEESIGQLNAAVDGLHCVFLLAGLGGGTGSGAAPVIAQLAREAGALVVAVVTLPFAFEGKRRAQQAAEALAALHEHADAIVCFENDRMADIVSANAGVQQAFAAVDCLISQSVRAIVALLKSGGPINLGFDDLLAALRQPGAGSRCLFGFGEAEGSNRPYEALSQALKNPLMDRGRLLHECDSVLVQVSGGPDMTLNEVQLLMEEFNRQVGERTRILFGATVAPELAGRLTVTVISSQNVDEPVAQAVAPVAAATSPLREIAQREAQRLAAEAAAAATAAERPDAPKLEVIQQEAPSMEAQAEAEVDPDEVESEGAFDVETAVEEPVAAELPDNVAAEVDDETPVEEIPAEPEPQPEKETRRRPLDDPQPSLFGAESKPSPVPPARPGMDPASTRIARPIPGRSMRADAARMPLRRTEPPAQPDPTPAVQPEPPPAACSEQPEALEPTPKPLKPLKAREPEPIPEPAAEPSPAVVDSDFDEPVEQEPPPVAPAKPVATPAPRTPPSRAPGPAAPTPAKGPLQETLQFEPVSRGRFDKGEPTIVDGQDLDVPTYMRRNVRVR